MCGIAGIAGKQLDADTIAAIDQCLTHRGPDAKGVFSRPQITLLHRRLSILDPTDRGNQPMTSADGRYTIILNGEVYNYELLKKDLPVQDWQTGTDTEVILAAFAHWGTTALQYFNGMFALALWDEQEQTLLLARDRMGIKPLYISRRGSQVAFASEVRSLMEFPGVGRQLNREALAHYFTYMTVYGRSTLVKGIELLPAGTYATWKAGAYQEERYWKAEEIASNKISGDRKTVVTEVRERLDRAVDRRMISDVPLGAFLSGGIDSSAIVALMAQRSERAVDTFSVVFEEKKYDESPWSELIARKYNTRHHPILLRPHDFLDALPAALSQMDHPSADGLNSYVVARETKARGITVALSGLGGDELFGGYPVFTQLPGILDAAAMRLPSFLRRLIAGGIGLGSNSRSTQKKQALLRLGKPGFASVYPVYRTVFEWEESLGLVKGSGKYRHPLDHIVREANLFQGRLSRISWAEIRSYTQAVLLRDMDQMSMAHALEARVPFFDHELVEYVLAIPDDIKWPNYPKQLLVEALGDLLPVDLVHRKKMGFEFPWAEWLRGPLRNWAEIRIESLLNRHLLDDNLLVKAWKEFQRDQGPWLWTHIWLPIVLEEWMTQNRIEV